MQYRNATFAFVGELRAIRDQGITVSPRGKATHEVLARTVQLQRPLERFITVPARRSDPFATIAETMWVLAGRADVAYLKRYLGRAPEFSDDGVVWRGGYGPRLRNWDGVDQIQGMLARLQADPETRRAIAVLFDPARDFEDTKDVPCNNWLHFLRREAQLHMNIVVRSNDVLWGFSGINTFEWSVLHEMMAHWLGLDVGPATFFISSLHLYDEFDERADRILKAFTDRSGYELGWRGMPFETSWEDFPSVLQAWFEIEAQLAEGHNVDRQISEFPDPLLRGFLMALKVKWAKESGASEQQLRALVDELGQTDLAFAAHEWLFRDSGDVETLDAEVFDVGDFRVTIEALHRRKDASYGNAWKRRGELVSIGSNLARKADRIESVSGGAPAGSESLLDTAVDLLVYVLKYETFLADQDPSVAAELFDGPGPFSDGPDGFEKLIARLDFPSTGSDVASAAAEVIQTFNVLDEFMRDHPSDAWPEKLVLAHELVAASSKFAITIAARDWVGMQNLRQEAGR